MSGPISIGVDFGSLLPSQTWDGEWLDGWTDNRPVIFNKHGVLHLPAAPPELPWDDRTMLAFEWRTACGLIHQNVRIAWVAKGARLPRWCKRCVPNPRPAPGLYRSGNRDALSVT